MPKIDWDAIRTYASLFILTIVALYAIWKDAKDYKERAWEERSTGFRRLLKRHAVEILYLVTITAAFLGAMDVHSTRHREVKDKADADANKLASDKQIQDLQAVVKASNVLLGQQRQDFLKQFSEMSFRVTELQTSIKTADLQEEAVQLRSDLESTRKTMEVPKATLSFAFVQDQGERSNLISLNLENGVVKVPFTVVNGSEADALEGMINLRACDGCKIVGNPEEFTRLNGQPDNERNMDFQHIFAKTNAPKKEVSIIPPPNEDTFQIGIIYRCRTCVLTRPNQTLPNNDVGVVLIGAHWKSRLLPKGLIAPLVK